MSDDDECVVCYDRPRAVRTQPCGHAFYLRCVSLCGPEAGGRAREPRRRSAALAKHAVVPDGAGAGG
eukprot:scaffold80232_cov75-Phaeocystis_antarctica.AAC.1